MSFVIVFLWTVVAVILGCMKLISLDTLFLGFSIMMAAEYLYFGKKDE
jgi:hypothetical protein